MLNIAERGKFVVVEGGVGCGKSTQGWLLAEKLGWMLLREPGGTPFGEAVRQILQERHDFVTPIDKVASMFGYMTCRAQLVAEGIIPRLESGISIVLDRFWPSTWAYQGAEGVDKRLIRTMAEVATSGLRPDLIIYYDLDPVEGQRRKNAAKQVQDRYDLKDLPFHRRVRQNYQKLGRSLGDIWETIDAGGSVDEVHQLTMAAMRRRNLIE